jgi:hypothetical protein
MLAAPKPCRECGKASEQGRLFCKDHAAKHESFDSQHRRKHDDVDLLYGRVRWINFREFILHRRPLCQKIIKGTPCRNPSRIIHHLISPRVDISKFVDPDNVLALCETCHTPEEGTPYWRPGIDYAYIPTDPPRIA